MSRDSSRNVLLAWVIASVVGLVLVFGPPAISEILQRNVMDFASYGLSQLNRLTSPSDKITDVSQDATAELAVLRQENRSLKHQVAELQDQLVQERELASYPLKDTPRLLTTEHLHTRILGEAGAVSPVGRRLLGLGAQHGLIGEELVLDGTGPLLDQGDNAGLEPDQLVIDGRAVLGRIVQVGRWTSVLQPVTSLEFRAAARLVRASPSGPVFGARGILAGAGATCRLDHVPASEAVSVGDAVYTDDPSLDHPLILGRITRCGLNPADPFWTIEVLPAASGSERQVMVVKSGFNPRRLAEDRDRQANAQ